MIVVDILDEQIEQAQIKANEMGRIRNSIRKGEGNLIGFLGEILFAKHFAGEISNTYDYDVIINEKKIDVKTKATTVAPKLNYLATVADFNTKQKCDSYYFVRIDFENRLGYLLGGLTKESFYKKAIFHKQGDQDPDSNLGWTFKADCYNLEISKLKQPKTFNKIKDL